MTEYTFYAMSIIFVLCLIGLLICYLTTDKEVLYFRFRCSNILDIELYDYVQSRPFFNLLNDRLEEHLRLYVQEHFYALGIPYEDLKLSVEVDYQCIHAICCIKTKKNNKQQEKIQQYIIQNVNLKQQIFEFYQFYEDINKPENLAVFKFKKPDEEFQLKNELIDECTETEDEDLVQDTDNVQNSLKFSPVVKYTYGK